ncbi:hypothetical protein RyT2_13380 [Pseudolactococcus yaeyamensis]
MPYDFFDKILRENQPREALPKELSGFEVKKLSFSLMTIYAKSYKNVSSIVEVLKTISSDFVVISPSLKHEEIAKNIKMIKLVMNLITFALLLIAVTIFISLFMMKNKMREKTFGILKAIGFKTKDIVILTTIEVVKIWLIISCGTILLSFVLGLLINRFLFGNLFSISVGSMFLILIESLCLIIVVNVIVINHEE